MEKKISQIKVTLPYIRINFTAYKIFQLFLKVQLLWGKRKCCGGQSEELKPNVFFFYNISELN